MNVKPKRLLGKLESHRQNLQEHYRKASGFLVKCQITKPYVEKGTLHGCVCPWEIGESADEGAFPILEDFHDTLEAIWVWSFFSKVSNKQTFKPNIDWAWTYIINNWKRFISEKENKSLYDCSHVLFSGTLFQTIFNNDIYKKQILQAGNLLEKYLSKPKSTDGREYYDPFWMVYCLSLATKSLKQEKWLKTSENFVRKTIVKVENPFSKVENEPKHRGLGSHDFFSKNANKVLALTSCFDQEKMAKDIVVNKFLPCLPRKFVSRHVDENAWNAHLATAIGKSYVLTNRKEFLNRFFVIMDELNERDVQKSAALPRSPSFSRRESWVTFFYAHAYASVTVDFANLV